MIKCHCQQDTLFSQPHFDAKFNVNVDLVLNQADMLGMQTSHFIQLAVFTNTQQVCGIAPYLLWLCVFMLTCSDVEFEL